MDLFFQNNDVSVSFDKYDKRADYCFLSHAHSDHLFRASHNIICSKPTKDLAVERGKKITSYKSKGFSVGDTSIRMVDSGHVLGSKALIINDDSQKTIYTGDFSPRTRSHLRGYKSVKCDTLFIESTFGSPRYVFPKYDDVVREFRDFATEQLSQGKNLLLLGYSLGKAQHLCEMVECFNHPVFFHSAVQRINQVYNNHGVSLIRGRSLESLGKEQSIVVAPSAALRGKILDKYKRDKNTVSVGFSGWALDNGYGFIRGADKGFVLSDHADFLELLRTVKKSGASKIYTYHGFNDLFADFLRAEGFSAESV